MSYGSQTHNPWEHDESPIDTEAEHFYPCSCGDPNCVADDRDTGNIRIGKGWYASDCALANAHPEVIRARELDAKWNEARR